MNEMKFLFSCDFIIFGEKNSTSWRIRFDIGCRCRCSKLTDPRELANGAQSRENVNKQKFEISCLFIIWHPTMTLIPFGYEQFDRTQ